MFSGLTTKLKSHAPIQVLIEATDAALREEGYQPNADQSGVNAACAYSRQFTDVRTTDARLKIPAPTSILVHVTNDHDKPRVVTLCRSHAWWYQLTIVIVGVLTASLSIGLVLTHHFVPGHPRLLLLLIVAGFGTMFGVWTLIPLLRGLTGLPIDMALMRVKLELVTLEIPFTLSLDHGFRYITIILILLALYAAAATWIALPHFGQHIYPVLVAVASALMVLLGHFYAAARVARHDDEFARLRLLTPFLNSQFALLFLCTGVFPLVLAGFTDTVFHATQQGGSRHLFTLLWLLQAVSIFAFLAGISQAVANIASTPFLLTSLLVWSDLPADRAVTMPGRGIAVLRRCSLAIATGGILVPIIATLFVIACWTGRAGLIPGSRHDPVSTLIKFLSTGMDHSTAVALARFFSFVPLTGFLLFLVLGSGDIMIQALRTAWRASPLNSDVVPQRVASCVRDALDQVDHPCTLSVLIEPGMFGARGSLLRRSRGCLVFDPKLCDRLTDDQLYAVIAHEIAHVQLGHGTITERWRLLGRLLCVGDALLISTIDTHRHELEADRHAIASFGASANSLDAAARTLAELQSDHFRGYTGLAMTARAPLVDTPSDPRKWETLADLWLDIYRGKIRIGYWHPRGRTGQNPKEFGRA